MVSSSGQANQRRKILIIDDDLDMLNLNRTILESHGYNVVSAQCGTEGLSILDRIQPPDLILLDYNLSDMQGPKFLEAFENQNSILRSQIPVVFLTARSKIPNIRANGFIQKSSDIDGFLQSVDGYINRSFGGAHTPSSPRQRRDKKERRDKHD